jgi:hypothetical protein
MPTPRPRRVLAVIAVLVALLTGAATVWMLHRQPPNGRRHAVATTPVTPRLSADPARTALGTQTPGPAPAHPLDVTSWRWQDFHGIALPSSAQDGPRHTRAGLASGFTDTPTGALLAAINIAVRTAAVWGPAIYTPTITVQVTGPDTAALQHADTVAYAQLRAAAHVRDGQPAGRGYAAVTAYRIAAYTSDAATVDLVTAGPGSDGTTVLAATRIGLIWAHGDWRVLAPPGGTWANAATTISSLSGYTIFPGEG